MCETCNILAYNVQFTFHTSFQYFVYNYIDIERCTLKKEIQHGRDSCLYPWRSVVELTFEVVE